MFGQQFTVCLFLSHFPPNIIMSSLKTGNSGVSWYLEESIISKTCYLILLPDSTAQESSGVLSEAGHRWFYPAMFWPLKLKCCHLLVGSGWAWSLSFPPSGTRWQHFSVHFFLLGQKSSFCSSYAVILIMNSTVAVLLSEEMQWVCNAEVPNIRPGSLNRSQTPIRHTGRLWKMWKRV